MKEYWVIPCNIKFFDIIKHFKQNNKVVWKASISTAKNDIVYIYVGSPISQIKYKCKVISSDVDENLLRDNLYAVTRYGITKRQKYIQLELKKAFDDSNLKYSKLKVNGLGQVQVQQRINDDLKFYLTTFE